MSGRRQLVAVLVAGVASGLLLGGAATMPFNAARVFAALPIELQSLLAQPYLFFARRGIEVPEPSALVFLLTSLAAGSLWGFVLGLAAGVHRPRLLALAGGLAFGLLLPLYAWTPVSAVPIPQLNDVPENIQFANVAINMLLGVVGLTGVALGVALGRPRLAVLLALGGSGAAVPAFLLTDLALEVAGLRVGGGNGAMPRVATAAFAAAAIAGGAMFAFLIARASGPSAAPA